MSLSTRPLRAMSRSYLIVAASTRQLSRPFARRFSSEPPRSQAPPSRAGRVENSRSVAIIAGAGLGLGACFFYLIGSPMKAKEAPTETPGGTKPGGSSA
ncbi:hypothetical protein HIM_10953 [Hirsutella minnesotensis 3608]|uniref:Uncharacterized protein n=1 Tax=Hirsutella minnesotensis 3608 TaxID=1043627 RepID=A0A0F7ZRI2_9HYPO|nr:hypothetical protein HIM_10953 [Hirsutella minnesotensis 3608]